MNYTYEYPRPSLAVDVLVLREIGSRKNILLIQRKHEPFKNQWALPGGFMNMDETLEAAAARELLEETGLIATGIKQLHTFSAIDRDPRGRTISVAFIAEVSPNSLPVAADDASDFGWFPLDDLPRLAFDHEQIIQLAYGSDK